MDKTTQFFTDSDWEGILLLVFFCKQYCSRCQSLDIWKAPQLYHVSSLFVTWRPPRLHGIWKDEGKIPICRFAWTFFPRLGLPPPSPSLSAVGAAVLPQGPRARGAIRTPWARSPLLCLRGTAPPASRGSLEFFSTAGLCGGGQFRRKLVARQHCLYDLLAVWRQTS